MSAGPVIVVTSGEPAGIGPDICLAVAEREWPCRLLVLADPVVITERARRLGSSVQLVVLGDEAPAAHRAGVMQILPIHAPAAVRPGELDQRNAGYVLDMLRTAAQGCLDGRFAAMVTAPVQKSIIAEAGVPFSGHTEFLADLTAAPRPVMLLVADDLRVALATTHIPLAAVPGALNTDDLVAILVILAEGLRKRFGISHPKILVLGLNPHAGESGHLGREDIDLIEPAIRAARALGIDARGPVPADTAFTPHSLADADAVLAMYHDQGLPVLKYVGFGRGVNVTLGLPIVRTSVDHGTALALAGRGTADAGSLAAAIDLAIRCAARA
jgi:4-hydroxythreonine-4-phosphate dehydrogenase